jgi:hypothetical protein
MIPLPETEPELAELHESLSAQRTRLNDETIRLDNRIKEVCEARVAVKYGVRIGSTVECLERNETGVVVSYHAFWNCERAPWLNVDFTHGGKGYGSTVRNFKVIAP